MDSVLIESPIETKSFNFARPNYGTMLKESIDRFLDSIHSETLDLSSFCSIFSRLLQSSADPPLEVIWFYSAINYHDSVPASRGLLDRVIAVKNLLQLFTACSSSCSGVKSIALLAPAFSDLYNCFLEAEKSTGKAAKKAKREIESLVEGILSYISICCGRDSDAEEFGTGLLPCFLDLVRVWTVRRSEAGSGLKEFFPLVSDEIRVRFAEEGCGVGYLAGVVIAEAFLLRLCLKVHAGGRGDSVADLRKESMIWAVSSVTVLRNQIFFDILLRLLLDSTLPVVPLLDSKDENHIKDILYDVVILVDYSFLHPQMMVDQSYDVMRSLTIRRLIVTHDAIRIARMNGDHGKAISYMNAFSASCLPSEIIKWVTNQIGVEKIQRPSASTPQVLLKWLLDLENHGLKLFEDSLLKLSSNLMFEELKDASDSMLNLKSKQQAEDDLFFFDNKGEVAEGAEDEEMQSTDAAFLAAAQAMKSPATNGRRKRKETRAEAETPVKFLKYKVHNCGAKNLFSSSADGMGSGSEVDNPPNASSDDEMEEMD